MTAKHEILQAFLNTEIVIDWTTNEELLTPFLEALEEYSPDTRWGSGTPLTEEEPANQYLNIDHGSLFSDSENYLKDYLHETPIIYIEDAFENFTTTDFTSVLDLL